MPALIKFPGARAAAGASPTVVYKSWVTGPRPHLSGRSAKGEFWRALASRATQTPKAWSLKSQTSAYDVCTTRGADSFYRCAADRFSLGKLHDVPQVRIGIVVPEPHEGWLKVSLPLGVPGIHPAKESLQGVTIGRDVDSA